MNFFGIGGLELLIILFLAFLLLGPRRMARTGKEVGKWAREARKMSSELTQSLSLLDEEPGESPKPDRGQKTPS